MNDNTKNLFPITQAAKVCGLSRSTLLRFEKRGLLTPAYITPESGRRYYDNHNITRILQIQKFQSIGFQTEEILPYFSSQGEAEGFLSILEKKLFILQQNVEEMRLRAHKTPHTTVQMTELPEMVYCMRKFNGLSAQNKYDAMYEFFHECVENGYILSSEPLFVINERTDYLEGQISSAPYDFQVCVPVLPEKAPENAIRFPACKALQVFHYGSYNSIEDAYLYLGRQVREFGLTPSGYVRSIGLVGPYVGREIDPEKFCQLLTLPIKKFEN